MTFSSSSSLSYQPHISRRRSSVVSSNGGLSPIDTTTPALALGGMTSPSPRNPSPSLESPTAYGASAIDYTYVCQKCGFGTELLSVYMPHTAYPCGEQPMEYAWGKL
ncbi:hypothetical protein IW140_004249 [Coemansia sp. RSA 1813]|nr:hypothetical protein LPJ74_003155 [Coemansia sp. RSA 1843]KAJ2088160.1 hypothetical protein IW138_004422 [Coemansia sp. RSA 986]KAJ2568004.1 hypothetical protein IW140_004249 [Coemansia sp. RSA 1813]